MKTQYQCEKYPKLDIFFELLDQKYNDNLNFTISNHLYKSIKYYQLILIDNQRVQTLRRTVYVQLSLAARYPASDLDLTIIQVIICHLYHHFLLRRLILNNQDYSFGYCNRQNMTLSRYQTLSLVLVTIVLDQSVEPFLSLGKVDEELSFSDYGLDLEFKHFVICHHSEFSCINILSQDKTNILKRLGNYLFELSVYLFYLYLEIPE